VFVGRWRSDIAQFANYNALAQAVADELNVKGLLCMTFEDIELAGGARPQATRIVAGAGANMDVVRSLMARRREWPLGQSTAGQCQ
jgi:hypothetical protein